MQQKVMVKNS